MDVSRLRHLSNKLLTISTKDAKSGVNKHLRTQHGIVGSINMHRQKTVFAVDAMTPPAVGMACSPIDENSRTHGVGRLRCVR